MNMEDRIQEFKDAAYAPKKLLKAHKAAGKKVIGVLPYFAPEELVYAAGMIPMGMWGTNTKTEKLSKEYCASFYCTIAQLDLEMLLDGTMDELDGVITPTCCDTLRPMSQNIRVAMSDKMPVIFLAHPQNRVPEYGIQFTIDQYTNVRKALEKIAGHEMTDDDILEAIKLCNRTRTLQLQFSKLAGQHPDLISAVARSAVFKAGRFMDKHVYNEKLAELNKELEAAPVKPWNGVKVLTSGIICDNPSLLQIFDDNHIAIVADDVAHESRQIHSNAPEDTVNPMRALAEQFANQDYDVLLYDKFSDQNRRGEYVAQLAKESGAQGVIVFMQTFCDPEEMEYPYLKKALDNAHIPHIKLGIDMQMRDFGQASTAIEAFADVLNV